MAEPVLVLRALGLGDALTGVPALRGLRRLHPHRPLVLAAPEDIGRWFVGLGLVDGFVATSGLGDDPPGRGLGPHDAVNLHGRGPQSHALLLAGNPRTLLAFAPSQTEGGVGPAAGAARGDTAEALPRWRADEHEVLRWCRLVSWAGGPCGPADLRVCANLHPHPHMWRTRDANRTPRTQERTTSATQERITSATQERATNAAQERTTSATQERATSGTRPGVVVLHPGAASGSRRWPVDRWAAVARVLTSRTVVLLTGSPDERPLCLQVARDAGLDDDSVVAGMIDLPQLMTLVGHAQLLVCGDTGVAHVATATGTTSVLLFGPTAPRLWGPLIDRDRHVCLWHGDGTGDPHATQPDPALLRITAAEVLDAADTLLSRDLGVA